jgi:hypothetical protein
MTGRQDDRQRILDEYMIDKLCFGSGLDPDAVGSLDLDPRNEEIGGKKEVISFKV